jgi:hypothetical protein
MLRYCTVLVLYLGAGGGGYRYRYRKTTCWGVWIVREGSEDDPQGLIDEGLRMRMARILCTVTRKLHAPPSDILLTSQFGQGSESGNGARTIQRVGT